MRIFLELARDVFKDLAKQHWRTILSIYAVSIIIVAALLGTSLVHGTFDRVIEEYGVAIAIGVIAAPVVLLALIPIVFAALMQTGFAALLLVRRIGDAFGFRGARFVSIFVFYFVMLSGTLFAFGGVKWLLGQIPDDSFEGWSLRIGGVAILLIAGCSFLAWYQTAKRSGD